MELLNALTKKTMEIVDKYPIRKHQPTGTRCFDHIYRVGDYFYVWCVKDATGTKGLAYGIISAINNVGIPCTEHLYNYVMEKYQGGDEEETAKEQRDHKNNTFHYNDRRQALVKWILGQ